MIGPADLEALGAIVGPNGLLTSAQDLRPYEEAARYGGGAAAAVVRPADTAEVSAVVGLLVRRGLPFVPQSGNTGLVGGSGPDPSGRQVVLSLDRLRGPLDIDPLERTAAAGAGVRLSTLNAALEPHGLVLPIDLGADPMLGGMAATNTGGARFIRYGDMRRAILGLEVVLADPAGTVLDMTSSLRKDNARLDMKQLFIGSGGAFGVITRVVVEVQPRPHQSASAILVPRDEDACIQILAGVERAVGGYLTAFEGMSQSAMRCAFDHVASLRNPFPGGQLPHYALLVELSRSWPPLVGEVPLETVLEDALIGLAELEGAPLVGGFVGPAAPLWALRHSLSEGLRASGVVVGLDLSFRRTDVFRFRREAAAMLHRSFPAYRVCDFGHVGDGGVHFNLVRPRDLAGGIALDTAAADAVTALAVERYGASFSGEHGLGRANQRLYDRYTPDLAKGYAGRLQRVFSPFEIGAVRYGPAPQFKATQIEE